MVSVSEMVSIWYESSPVDEIGETFLFSCSNHTRLS